MEILNRLVFVVEFTGVPRRGRGCPSAKLVHVCNLIPRLLSLPPPTQESRKREAYLDFGLSVAAFCRNFLPPVCYYNHLSAQNIT